MKTGRTVITIGYNTREEVEPGVWENVITEKTVKASEQRIFQSRRDQALADNLVLTKRFKVRDHYAPDTAVKKIQKVDYVTNDGVKYKVRSITEDPSKHFIIIETGEMI